EWLHKGAPFTAADEATGISEGDHLTVDLFNRLLDEEYQKLLDADNRDVHNDSKTTTLPIARAIAEAYVLDSVKAPWYVDLLNINLGVDDAAEGSRRIQMYLDAFRKDGTRITKNLDFNRG